MEAGDLWAVKHCTVHRAQYWMVETRNLILPTCFFVFTVSCFYTNECWDWVGSPASCLAGPGFKYLPRDLPSWLGLWFSSVVPGWCLELSHNGFLPVHCTSLFTGHLYCLVLCSLHLYLVFAITCAEREKPLILNNTCSVCFYTENWSQLVTYPSLSFSLARARKHTRTRVKSMLHKCFPETKWLGQRYSGVVVMAVLHMCG